MWPFRSRRLNLAYQIGRKRLLRRHARELERAQVLIDDAEHEARFYRGLYHTSVVLNESLQALNELLLAEVADHRQRDMEPGHRPTRH